MERSSSIGQVERAAAVLDEIQDHRYLPSRTDSPPRVERDVQAPAVQSDPDPINDTPPYKPDGWTVEAELAEIFRGLPPGPESRCATGTPLIRRRASR